MAAVVGIGGTTFLGYRQGRTAHQMVLAEGAQRKTEAREERLQRRLETAYLELGKIMVELEDWVADVYPILEREGVSPLPPAPSPEARRMALAWQFAWSPEVEQLFALWDATLRKVTGTVYVLSAIDNRSARREPAWPNDMQRRGAAMERLQQLRTEFQERADAIRCQTALELKRDVIPQV